MNARQFFNLVAEMRTAQQNYFALRKSDDQIARRQALQHSIELERQVDAEIARVNEILIRQSQP